MSKISIHSAITGSFSLYFRHILLIALAGVVTGTASWLAMTGPRYVAQSMGIYQQSEELCFIVQENADAQAVVTGVVDHVNRKINAYMDNSPRGLLFLLFIAALFFWFLSSFIHLGFMRLALQLVDKNKSDMHALVSSKDVYLSYIGSAILYGLYAIVIMVGSAMVFVPVFLIISKLSNLSMVIKSIGVLIVAMVMIGVWGYLIRYIMFAYCIIDKRVSARESLHMSAKITAGERMHLFMFLFIMVLVLGVVGGLIKTVFCFRCAEMSLQGLLYMIGMAATATPLMMLMFAKVYRQLTSK